MSQLALCAVLGALEDFRVPFGCLGCLGLTGGFQGFLWQWQSESGGFGSAALVGDLVAFSKEKRRLPAVYWFAGSCLRRLGHALDDVSFAAGCSEVAPFMGEASDDAAVPVVMIEMEWLAWQHQLSASDARCVVRLWE